MTGIRAAVAVLLNRRVIGSVALLAALAAGLIYRDHQAAAGSGHDFTTSPTQALPVPPGVSTSAGRSIPAASSPGPDADRHQGKHEPDEHDHEPPGTPRDPNEPVDPRDREQAEQFSQVRATARAFLNDFARPDPATPAERWWAAAARHMSRVGRETYAGTDPQEVPYTRVIGAVTILPTPSQGIPGHDTSHDTSQGESQDGSANPNSGLLIARARTDAGYYRLQLSVTPGTDNPVGSLGSGQRAAGPGLQVDAIRSETSLRLARTQRW